MLEPAVICYLSLGCSNLVREGVGEDGGRVSFKAIPTMLVRKKVIFMYKYERFM